MIILMLPFKSNAPVQPVKLYIIIFGLSDRQKGISYPQIGREKNVVLRAVCRGPRLSENKFLELS